MKYPISRCLVYLLNDVIQIKINLSISMRDRTKIPGKLPRTNPIHLHFYFWSNRAIDHIIHFQCSIWPFPNATHTFPCSTCNCCSDPDCDRDFCQFVNRETRPSNWVSDFRSWNPRICPVRWLLGARWTAGLFNIHSRVTSDDWIC